MRAHPFLVTVKNLFFRGGKEGIDEESIGPPPKKDDFRGKQLFFVKKEARIKTTLKQMRPGVKSLNES